VSAGPRSGGIVATLQANLHHWQEREMQTHLSVVLARAAKVRGQVESRGGRVCAVAYHVYILASSSGVLYTGVTNNLERRVMEYKQEICDGFTKKYEVTRLLYFEAFGDVRDAISREKQIKRWRREKKLALIREMNPRFRDLSEDFQR
jgi:putative endonuclease